MAKAKKHVDGVVAEETKGLVVERDALVKEVDRLKKYEPKERDGKWAKAQMGEVAETMRKLAAQCLLLIGDEQIEADRRLQAEVEAKITEAEGYLQDIRREWIDRFVDDF